MQVVGKGLHHREVRLAVFGGQQMDNPPPVVVGIAPPVAGSGGRLDPVGDGPGGFVAGLHPVAALFQFIAGLPNQPAAGFEVMFHARQVAVAAVRVGCHGGAFLLFPPL